MPNSIPANAFRAAKLAQVHAYIAICRLIEHATADRIDATSAPNSDDFTRSAVSMGYAMTLDVLRRERDSLRDVIDWGLYAQESTRIFEREV